MVKGRRREVVLGVIDAEQQLAQRRDAVVELIVEHWELSRDLLDYFVKPDPLSYEMAAASGLKGHY